MIRVENLTIRAGEFRLRDVSFEAPTGSYAVLMGKTGSGKTTLLEGICGLKRIESGSVFLGDRDVTYAKPAERGIGFVPQDGALFRTMTVYDNIAFALTVRGWSDGEIRERVDELAELLGVTHLLDRHITGLSGGEQQRISLGRALAARPSILCLDEPLSALDDDTREEMYTLLRSVREHSHVTTLHITHNIAETQNLADRLFIIANGGLTERPIKRPDSTPSIETV
ncbi:MAG: ATP-binding cassette domain-containing protein [Phycisphaera sp.]|nr:ATP-binding cassette domain-containing protein [Phycisphaera sp.]